MREPIVSTGSNPIDCAMVQKIMGFLPEGIYPVERSAVLTHINDCPECCQQYLEQFLQSFS